jgi:hypothetical protein
MSVICTHFALDSNHLSGDSHTVHWCETHQEPGFLVYGGLEIRNSQVYARIPREAADTTIPSGQTSIRLSNDRVIYVHKVVLCSRNEYFKALCRLESRFAVSTDKRHESDLAANTPPGERADRDRAQRR